VCHVMWRSLQAALMKFETEAEAIAVANDTGEHSAPKPLLVVGPSQVMGRRSVDIDR
jgi:hypothetical protein